MIMFDVDAIMKDPTLNTLNWELITARGIDAGDLVQLFETAVAMGESSARCHFLAMEWIVPQDENMFPSSVEIDVASTYAMMSKFMAREAREVVKFLYLRGFIFPEGTTGPKPDDAIGL